MVKYLDVNVVEWSMDLIEAGTPEFDEAHFDLWPGGTILANEKVAAVFGAGATWEVAYQRACMNLQSNGIDLGDEQIDQGFHHCRWFDDKQPKPEGECFVRFTRLN